MREADLPRERQERDRERASSLEGEPLDPFLVLEAERLRCVAHVVSRIVAAEYILEVDESSFYVEERVQIFRVDCEFQLDESDRASEVDRLLDLITAVLIVCENLVSVGGTFPKAGADARTMRSSIQTSRSCWRRAT